MSCSATHWSCPAAAQRAWKRLTLALLRSPEPRLAASALNELVLAGDAVDLGEADLPELLGLVAQDLGSGTPGIGIRIGVLAELERRRLVETPERWARLLRDTEGEALLAVVRAVGAHPSPPVTGELLRLLGEDDDAVVYAAVLALGAPSNDPAVAPLGGILEGGNDRLRMAAIRSLGRIATPAARALLETTARSHPDSATRRRAGAELSALGELRAHR